MEIKKIKTSEAVLKDYDHKRHDMRLYICYIDIC